MRVKDFSKTKTIFDLPYLLAVQRESWERFWKQDLKELFSEISPIRDYTGKELELWFLDYELDKPKYKDKSEAKRNNASFEAPLKVKTKLVNLKTKEIKEQEVFLTNFPLMTERGTFVINGIERIAISQLIRSSGVFFTLQVLQGKRCFGAKIIPNRGAWLEFETSRYGFIGVKINRRRRVAATTFLKALGIESDEEIKKIFEDVDVGEVKFIKETLTRDSTKNQPEALVEVYRKLRPGDIATPGTARELFENMFYNIKRYDFSKVGRWKMWQRLPELREQSIKKSSGKGDPNSWEITLEDRILYPEDVVAVMREMIRLNNNPGAKPDNIDHLGNRRVRVSTELLLNSLRLGLKRTERIVRDRMSTLDIATLTPSQLINPRPFIASVKQFFTSQMSQFMDNENVLAELEHKRRLAATGPGGLQRKRAGSEVRDVQSSHYGRICPIQTPEGPNVGLIGHLASFARVNPYGFIETPYLKVKKGIVTKEIQYLDAFEEERYNIASAGAAIDKSGKIIPQKVTARIKGEPGIVDRNKIDFIDVSPEQFLSVATSCIPFLQNNDANRALMGSNMQRQAVPLLKTEAPLVLTGREGDVAKDSGQAVLARESGTVVEVDARHIRIKSNQDKIQGEFPHQKSGEGREQVYDLSTFVGTNQYTCFHQRPVVKKGQKVNKGTVLAEGGAIDKGEMALGKNVLVAFMAWRGGNYEDAIIMSERLLKEDTFSSMHIKSFGCDVRDTKLGPEVVTWDIPNVSERKLKDLDEEGIIRVGAEVSQNDILVGKISPKGKEDLTAEERLVKAIFGEKAKEVKDTSLLMEHGERGRVIGIKTFSRDQGHELSPGIIKRIEVEVAQLRKITLGDKLSNRHGNKGVISMILPEEDMPFVKDGTPVDIILNPLGVGKRMNIGQILETHLGFAAQKLGYSAISPSMSGATEKEIKEELRKAGFPEDGKAVLYDGRTGEPFSEKVTVGYLYMLKLVHMAEDKIHMRAIGPYSLITQQPLGGKAQFGGQRFGEMEVWALEGYGAAHILQEMLTIKSDDVLGRAATYQAILKGGEIRPPNIPASFNLLVNELKSLALNIEFKK